MRYYTIFILLVLISCRTRDKLSEADTKDYLSKENLTSEPQQKATDDSFSKSDHDVQLLDLYFKLTMSLAQNNSRDAAKSGKDMANLIELRLDTAAPSGTVTEILRDAKRHAEHISENANNIDHQREHLVFLSRDIFDLVKEIKPGMTLYKISCKDREEYWVSKDVSTVNPYSQDDRECKRISEKI